MVGKYEWMDDPEVVQLNGEPIPGEMEFLVDAPPEIGRVRAAYSTAVKDKPLRSLSKRLVIIVMVYTACALPIPLLAPSGRGHEPWIVGPILAVLSIPFSLYFTRGSNWAAYVGDLGFATYKLRSKCGNVKVTGLFEFQNALDLYTWSAKHYAEGVYAGTSYRFDWRDSHGKLVCRLAGRYNGKKAAPRLDDPCYVAFAAERYWTHFLNDAINIELEQQGAVHFKVNKRDWVKVGRDNIHLHFKNKDTCLAVEDIEDLRISNGRVSIKSKDAGWFGGKGKFGFAYGRMANASLFLTCLEHLCGYRYE